jgi:ABC-type uncharacterized transport system involved in gliding motility auxiliary subunit
MVDHVPPQHRGTSIFRTYAWLIAIVGILIFIGSGLIYLIYQTWKTHAEVGVGIGVVLLLGAVLLRPDVVRTVIAGRPVKYASNALVMSLAFIGIVGLVNFLVAKNTWEYDLTESAQFTFSQQTIQVLEKLDRPVEIIGFFQSGDPRQDLAKGYLERSSQYTPYLTYEFHDPNIEPTLAQSYELSNYGLVFVSGNNTLEAHTVDEETITSGLIRVTSDQQKQVYFITGHGELGLTNPAPEGLSEVKAALEQENYLVQTINLATALDSLSADSTILILAGAKRDLLDPEVAVLNDWMSTGGKFMILSNPLDPIPLPQLLENYGLSLGDDLVADEDNYKVGLAPTSPLIVQYPFHEITQGLNGFFTFFPLARSLTIEPKDISIARLTTPILTTGPNMTGSDNGMLRRQAEELSFVAYLCKPFPAAKLLEAIERVVGGTFLSG